MEESKVLILDTSALIDLYKRKEKSRIKEFILENKGYYEVSICGVVMYEFLSYGGTVDHAFVKSIPCHGLDCDDFGRAGFIRSQMLKKKLEIFHPDLLIASFCIERNFTLLTCDKDYEVYKRFGLNVFIV